MRMHSCEGINMPTMLKNAMETIVMQKIEEMGPSLNCCLCDQCKCDIAAYALNHIPAKYVSSLEGELYCKVSSLTPQLHSDIVSAIMQAVQVVRANPRH